MMRRLAALSLITVAALSSSAGPAAAHRDPFEPAIDESAVEQPVGGEATAEQEPAVQAPPEPLADTGLDGRPWVALAYALVALGGGFLVLSRIARPTSK